MEPRLKAKCTEQRQRRGPLIVALLLIVLVAGIRIVAAAHKQADAREEDRAAIQKILIEQQSAWNVGDINAFLQAYWHSPELTFSGSSGVARGWEGVAARYRKNYPDRAAMGQLEFSDLEFRFLGRDAALVLGRWHLAREKNGDTGGVFSLVWQKFPEGWRIVHDLTSVDEP